MLVMGLLVDVKLGSSPVSSLRVVSDGVVSLISDPVREGSVLLGLLGKLFLDDQSFVGTHF